MKRKNLTSNNKKFKTKKVANIYDGWKDMSTGEKAGGIASAAAGALQLVGDAMGAANKIDTSKADNAIAAVESFQPQEATSLDSLNAQINSVESAKTDWKGSDFGMSTAEGLTSLGTSMASGAAAGAALGPWGAVAGAAAGLVTSGAGWIANAVKSKSKADELNRKAEAANYIADQKGQAAVESLKETQHSDFMKRIKSYGGPLYNHSGDWSNGLTFITEGGTHEENPFDGVLMGFDQEGIPNLVEEGEIIYNDYVFSNRLKPSKKQLESSGLNKKYNDWTFAKIVEDLQKASAETPLDKISKESLDDMMTTMINMQEEVRMKKGLTGENRLMKFGGNKRILSGEKKTRAELGKETTAAMPKLSSGALGLQSSPSNIGGASPLGNDALRTKSINTFNKKIKADIQNSLNNINKSDFNWSSLGMYAPIVDSLGKTIYNIAKPIDESNILAEDAYRELPVMELPRLTQHKVAYKPIDRNALINPVINTGRATARDIQNLGTTGADVMNRLALNAYNTQKAIGQAYLEADAKDLANRMQNAQFNLGVDSADAQLLQAVQAANLQRAEKIAAARIADATQLEQLEQLKGQAIDTTSTAAIQGLADLTRQNIEWNWIKNNPQYAEAVAAIYGKKANGGMLTRKKRRK